MEGKRENKDNTNYVFKLLYAIGIILIVAGHCQGGGFSLFYEFFPMCAFHLGLFMFASGYFYKCEYENNVKQYILKKIKRLIIPLYLWNIFYAFVIYCLHSHGFFLKKAVTLNAIFIEPILNGHQFMLNLGGWFIIPLFSIHILNILIRKIFKIYNIKINEFIFFAISLGLGCLGVSLAHAGYNHDWFLFLDRILYFIPFYGLGILYKKYEQYDKVNNLIYFSVILAIALYYIYDKGGMPFFVPAWCNNFTANPILPFIVGFLGVAFWLRIAKILEPAIGKSKSVNAIANNTYSIMINHLSGFFILNACFAFISKYTAHFQNFDMNKYKTDVFYNYLPGGLDQMLILYLITGIVFSIIVQFILDKISVKLKKLPKPNF
ncbi:MAG: acyltransferase [Candidatus Gastranaerophilales bacterium]|nr:acyltransferase [Candidatus Gastranaerophilales bacterium]